MKLERIIYEILNEDRMPKKIKRSQVSEYFPDSADEIIEKIWGKSATGIYQALNGEYYWLTFQADPIRFFDAGFIVLRKTKKHANGSFS